MTTFQEQLETLPAYRQAPPGKSHAQLQEAWAKPLPDPNTDILGSWLRDTLQPCRRRVQSSRPRRPASHITVKAIGGGYWLATVALDGGVCRGLAPDPHEAISRVKAMNGGRRPF
jgi:hypothetical protein